MNVEAVLGRAERPAEIPDLDGARILITGGEGSLGQALARQLDVLDVAHKVTDEATFDVLSPNRNVVRFFKPTHLVHLAADKHAPGGELDPLATARLNIGGTANVLSVARQVGARAVVASTCKACDPETAYGASKLIAERLARNAGETVVRYFNVPETRGNVFELWANTSGPLPVTDCWRYFISLGEAVALTLNVLTRPPGRYTIDPGPARWMPSVADDLYPGRDQHLIPPRRGDRVAEPLCASNETLEYVTLDLMRIVGAHDPVRLAVAA